MTRTFWQALIGGIFVVALLPLVQPAAAETLFHRAENQVPVAIVDIKRPAEHTEIHLQTQAALTKVDYAASETMILRFEPLAAGSSTFSFVSGQGGEKQPIDAVSPTTPYWNFIRVRLN